MKRLLSRIFMAGALMTLVVSLHAQTRPVQNFDTSAGQVKITPIYHATPVSYTHLTLPTICSV